MTRLRFPALALRLAIGVLCAVAGYQAAAADDAYAHLQDRPMPKTSGEKDSECAWIRTEETRIQAQAEQGIATSAKYGSPALADSIKANANQSVRHLDDRYAQIQCVQVKTTAVPLSQTLFPQTLPPVQAPTAPVPPAQAAVPPPAPVPMSQTMAPAPAPPVTMTQAMPPPAAAPLSHAAIPPPPAAVPMSSAAVPAAQATAPPSQPCGGLTFDQCFAKCRELTKRTAEQCFDACRH